MSVRAVVMATDWIAALPEVHERFGREPPAAFADLVCGEGWSAIGVARSYPDVSVAGWDDDDRRIAIARRNASDADLGRRVVFEVSPPTVGTGHVGRYDLVTSSTPLDHGRTADDVLRRARAMVGEGGAVVVVHAQRVDVLIERAWAAGFSEVVPLPIPHDVFGIHLLRC